MRTAISALIVTAGLLAPSPTPGLENLLRQDAARLARQILDDGVWLARAVVVRVSDGSTIIMDLDLGWSTWRRGEVVRLAAVQPPGPGDRNRQEAASPPSD